MSLSKHIGFGLAYLISATACVALIGFYVCHALRSLARGSGFAVGLGTLYALLFGLLGVFMVLTRKLDWYAAAPRPAEPAKRQWR